MGGYKTKDHMTYQPEDPLKKAELMAVEMRRSKRRDFIASIYALRNPQTTEEQPVYAICCGRREDTLSNLNQTELLLKQAHSMP